MKIFIFWVLNSYCYNLNFMIFSFIFEWSQLIKSFATSVGVSVCMRRWCLLASVVLQDSPDAVKLLSILVEIFGPVQIFSEFDSSNAMDIETKMKHFLHTFNNDFIPWCLQGVGSFGNLKLDFLLDLFQDDYFFEQWCAVITYCVDDKKFTESSDDISNIQVLAMLIGKVRERIRSKKLGRLRKFGLSPEHWHHDLLNSSAINFAHQTSMINCHAQFLW